jgi:hypothetical protein
VPGAQAAPPARSRAEAAAPPVVEASAEGAQLDAATLPVAAGDDSSAGR